MVFSFEGYYSHYALISASFIAWVLQITFGECSFERHKVDGPYGVGYKEFRTIVKGNIVGVYYPMDKCEYLD
jgi:hypothetical protein